MFLSWYLSLPCIWKVHAWKVFSLGKVVNRIKVPFRLLLDLDSEASSTQVGLCTQSIPAAWVWNWTTGQRIIRHVQLDSCYKGAGGISGLSVLPVHCVRKCSLLKKTKSLPWREIGLPVGLKALHCVLSSGRKSCPSSILSWFCFFLKLHKETIRYPCCQRERGDRERVYWP